MKVGVSEHWTPTFNSGSHMGSSCKSLIADKLYSIPLNCTIYNVRLLMSAPYLEQLPLLYSDRGTQRITGVDGVGRTGIRYPIICKVIGLVLATLFSQEPIRRPTSTVGARAHSVLQ